MREKRRGRKRGRERRSERGRKRKRGKGDGAAVTSLKGKWRKICWPAFFCIKLYLWILLGQKENRFLFFFKHGSVSLYVVIIKVLFLFGFIIRSFCIIIWWPLNKVRINIT